MAEILIIDDDHQMRNLLREALLLDGLQADVAADGNEAAKHTASHAYKVVVTDIVMPDKDGFEVIFEMKSKYPQTQIIAISGGGRLNANDYLESARKFGVAATFSKPINRKELIAKIRELLALSADTL